MTQKKDMVNSLMKILITATIALSFAMVCTSSTAFAKKRVKYGTLEVTTTPGGLPISIDGRPEGTTTTTVRRIELDPGHHSVDIVLPNGGHWVREFDIERSRRLCLNLNYTPKKYTPPTSPCPYPVIVSSPPTVNDGDLITFTADVSYSGTSTLNYVWTVAPGEARIVSGVGTSTIIVDSTGLGGQKIVATLVVDDGTGDPMCHVTTLASTIVTRKELPAPECRKFDEFPSIAFDDTKARLDNLAIELQNAPDATAYIFVYAGRRSRTGQADALGRRAADYLVNSRGVDLRRINIINGGYRDDDYIEIWICPPGATAPHASPTVQPSDVQPTRERTQPRRPRRGE
jgi:PEGA domain-containing protein